MKNHCPFTHTECDKECILYTSQYEKDKLTGEKYSPFCGRFGTIFPFEVI